MSELLCTELSAIPISSRLHHDHRRLAILLEQEERFMPNISYPHLCGTVSEEERTKMLEVIYEVQAQCVVCKVNNLQSVRAETTPYASRLTDQLSVIATIR